jgi:hypothetical protein
MILLFLFLLLVITVVAIYYQGQRQHRETLRMINPEEFAKTEARQDRLRRFDHLFLAGTLGAVALFVWFLYMCSKATPPKAHQTIEYHEISR